MEEIALPDEDLSHDKEEVDWVEDPSIEVQEDESQKVDDEEE